MKLPTLAAPSRRIARSAAVMGTIAPQKKIYTTDWIGTAPYCAGDCEYCHKRGENCDQSNCGDGACCNNGWKVRCYVNA